MGKTLLLRALAGYYRPESGSVLWGGRDVWAYREEYLGQVGFIPQTDILYDTLTVRENLEYAARLRLPQLAVPDREALIKDLLGLLQLSAHAEKRAVILSGGQRKRVSVAIELLRKPPILLLDEPTTGLDPGNEARLIENLRQVARRDTVVILSTHSLTPLHLFDEVLVLARLGGAGRQVYCGSPEGLEKRMAGMHPADWYDALEQGRAVPQLTAQPPALPGGVAPSTPACPAPAAASDSGSPAPSSKYELPLRRMAQRKDTATGWQQLLHVAARGAKQIVRDRALVTMIVLQPIVLALLVILSQFHADKINPILFFTVVVAVWLGMNNTVRDLVRERRNYIRDRMAGLKAEAYLASKIGLYLLIGIVQLTLFLLLTRWGCMKVLGQDVAKDVGNEAVFAWLAILLLVYACGMGLGMIVTLSRTEETAVAALPVLILPQILLSAVATNEDTTSYSDARIFRPIVVTLQAGYGKLEENPSQPETNPGESKTGVDSWDIGGVGATTDVLSMLCCSRPALLVLERPDLQSYGFAKSIWLGDLFHLLVLLFGTYAVMWALFTRYESRWPALVAM